MKFEISEVEMKTIRRWRENLPWTDWKSDQVVGRITYSFTPTGIGDVLKVKDTASEEEVDVTDYSMW